MPFTLSHPLAVIPLKRTGLVFSALVVGSMSPDFEYFLRWRQDHHGSHTLLGLFAFCLPSSLVVLWIWHELLKRPLIELAPESHRVRLAFAEREFSFGPGRRFLVICASVLLGAITHIAWDSFTHPWGWPVQNLALLRMEVSPPVIEGKPLFRHLQHASTVLGFLALMALYLIWFRNAKPAHDRVGLIPSRLRPCLYLPAGAIALAYGAAIAAHRFPLEDPENFKGFVVRTAVVAMSTFALFTIGYALWFRWRFRNR